MSGSGVVVEGSAIEGALQHMLDLLNAPPEPEAAAAKRSEAQDEPPRYPPGTQAGIIHRPLRRLPRRAHCTPPRTDRLLLLAGTDRPGQPLMIAQMQGQFWSLDLRRAFTDTSITKVATTSRQKRSLDCARRQPEAVTTMRVPQEIDDAIIDNFGMSHDEKISPHGYGREPDDTDSLRACSLTSRSFLRRSRMHLFAAIFCQRLSDFSHFDRLLAESPHIGELYVRYFSLKIRLADRRDPLLTEGVVFPRILSRLPRLTHVSLNSIMDGYIPFWGSLPSLFKLELLLSNATGLKALTLGGIIFENPSLRRVDVPHEVRVVLESFELGRGMDEVVDAMVSSFRTVDIKHLKSLATKSLSIIPLLKANAQTIQKVRASFPRYPNPPDPDILKGNQTLHLIEITEHSSGMASALQQFGHLGHLKALKTMSLDFTDNWRVGSPNAADWTKLDAILSSAVDGLEDIHIHTEHPLDVELIRSLLPSVGENIAVHTPARQTERLFEYINDPIVILLIPGRNQNLHRLNSKTAWVVEFWQAEVEVTSVAKFVVLGF
ncbi:hypothetical protein C8J57DRAFT_1233305 [Mycena rebaudengoi]|nr:hypothetical protein C8J57DRAFT_1233305 [Mycena rebaudengoi]